MDSNGGKEEEFHIDTLDYPTHRDAGITQTIMYGPVPSMAFCAVTYVPFVAEVTFEYIPADKIIEFESFDEWLGKEVPTEPHTIESLGLRIFSALLEVLGDIPLTVLVTAKTTVHGPAETEITNEKWRFT